MKQTLLSIALLPTLALVGCNPDAVDGVGEIRLSFGASQASLRTVTRATTTVSSIPVTDSAGQAGGTISLTEAWVVVEEIELEHENDDDDGPEEELEVEFTGPYAVNLLDGTTYPALPSVSIDTGLYNDIEIDIEKLSDSDLIGMPNLPQGIADQLVDYSMYLEGTYTSQDGSTYVNIPFSLSNDQSDEFELSGTDFSQGFVVDDTGINDIIVAFRLNEWFRFDSLETNSDGHEITDAITATDSGYELTLNGNTHSDIMEVIEDNIEESAEYGEDDDDDGELDEDEDDDDYDDYDDD